MRSIHLGKKYTFKTGIHLLLDLLTNEATNCPLTQVEPLLIFYSSPSHLSMNWLKSASLISHWKSCKTTVITLPVRRAILSPVQCVRKVTSVTILRAVMWIAMVISYCNLFVQQKLFNLLTLLLFIFKFKLIKHYWCMNETKLRDLRIGLFFLRHWTSFSGWKLRPSQRHLSISLDHGRRLSNF